MRLRTTTPHPHHYQHPRRAVAGSDHIGNLADVAGRRASPKRPRSSSSTRWTRRRQPFRLRPHARDGDRGHSGAVKDGTASTATGSSAREARARMIGHLRLLSPLKARSHSTSRPARPISFSWRRRNEAWITLVQGRLPRVGARSIVAGPLGHNTPVRINADLLAYMKFGQLPRRRDDRRLGPPGYDGVQRGAVQAGRIRLMTSFAAQGSFTSRGRHGCGAMPSRRIFVR